MHNSNDHEGKTIIERVQASLFFLAFGLGILAFLILIDRPEWFVVRPASGTAAAMSLAADRHDDGGALH